MRRVRSLPLKGSWGSGSQSSQQFLGGEDRADVSGAIDPSDPGFERAQHTRRYPGHHRVVRDLAADDGSGSDHDVATDPTSGKDQRAMTDHSSGSEERSVGQEWVRTFRSRGSPYHKKKK